VAFDVFADCKADKLGPAALVVDRAGLFCEFIEAGDEVRIDPSVDGDFLTGWAFRGHLSGNHSDGRF
jgi:hypothetical protein